MTATYEQLRGCLVIDKAALDDELINQSQLYFNIGEAYVEAVDKRDYLKEQLAVVEAELDAIVRDNDEKLTNAAVAAKVRKHPRRKKAYEAYAKAKLEADKLQVLKESFHQRAKMLQNLCELYVSNYWERNAFRGNSRQDATVYEHRRKRLALHREQKT